MKDKHPIIKAIAQLIFLLGRMMLSLRYKVTLSRIDHIDKNRPVLFLPNHQAVVDPMLLVSYLYPHKNIVPVITSTYYDLPILYKFFKNWGAVRVSDLEAGSRNTNVLNDITNATTKAFEYKRSIVIYPAGQIAGQGFERILNKKGAHEIVKNIPDDVQIVGVRISGLWGSTWSKAWTGQSPNFVKRVFKSFFYSLANLIFFMPRRHVHMHFEDLTETLKLSSTRDKHVFNNHLEQFYNAQGEESPVFLKHYFYSPKLKRKLPDVIKGSVVHVKSAKVQNKLKKYPLAITKGVNKIVAQQLQININEIKEESDLIIDLGADSLSMVEIISAVEKQFNVETINDVSELKVVHDIYMLANGDLQYQQALPPCSFKTSAPFKDYIKINSLENIPTQIIQRFTSNPNLAFSYDAMLGETTRKNFLLKACVVAEIIKQKTDNERIGIMLPALQSTTLLITATYLAGKIPVMLNWTVGQKILDHCITEANIDKILTAGSFVEKVKDQLPGSITEKLVLLEKEVPNAGIKTKLTGAIKSKFPKWLINTQNISDTAVILFTSGSENLPKAVPLTHSNIIHDLKGTLELINLERNQILLASLPPFHSFGFTILSILPLLTGVRTAYYPDPTDGKGIVRTLKHTSSSILVSAPSFLKIILGNAIPEDLVSLKLVVSGAEAMPPEIKSFLGSLAPQATLIEGYGITECAPVLSLNPLQLQKERSVGKIIKGVDCKIISLETSNILPPNNEGMICFKGPNVFNGYLNDQIQSPFIDIDGSSYYKTGDLGYLDTDGYLFITGRLKRFVKIAGEMISLPFLEEVLSFKFGDDEEKVLAIEGNDKVNPVQIVLFTSKPISIKEANEHLRLSNAPPIAKITKVELVEAIPMLGTGKIDYKLLKEMVQ
ncbi:hypothetical protein E9993_17240 [Labilibacter sediminis]|nr:hypothetical protein E9993_17240 [Labilibacter sediminis]